MINKISFKKKEKIIVYMEDGRTIIIPLNHFPSLQKLSLNKRKRYTIVSTDNNQQRGIIFNRSILFETKDFLQGKEIFA
ncbi:MAG: DUF2442 domain-containing protein [Bacteroidota bacterium]